MTRHLTVLICGFSILAGCAKEPPPRSVTEFVENPILLEAAMVRCSENRSKSRYDAECVNARAAVARIQAREEADRAAALEAASESKRKALRRMRRTQAAADEARRRAEKAREEAEYLSQFGVLPPAEGEPAEEPLPEGNVPVAVVPEATENSNAPAADVPESTEGSNAPVMETEPESPQSDLESVRDELRRRNEENQD